MKRGTIKHPKTLALAESLKIPIAQAIGHLEALWHFTAQYAIQGDIGRWDDKLIAESCLWDGEAERFTSALVECGWLDVDEEHRLVVHDWAEHADQSTKKVLANRKLEFIKSSRPKNQKPVVYFVRAKGSGRIKIGTTDRAVEKHVSEISSFCPEGIELLGTVKGGICTEDQLHQQFAKYRRNGEWFDPAPELLAVIKMATGFHPSGRNDSTRTDIPPKPYPKPKPKPSHSQSLPEAEAEEGAPPQLAQDGEPPAETPAGNGGSGSGNSPSGLSVSGSGSGGTAKPRDDGKLPPLPLAPGDIGIEIAKRLALRPRVGDQKQYTADCHCLLLVAQRVLVGNAGPPREAIDACYAKAEDLATSRVQNRMAAFLAWFKERLKVHGHEWKPRSMDGAIAGVLAGIRPGGGA